MRHIHIQYLFIFQGYKVYYTTNSNLPLSQWESQFVDNNKLTTVSDLVPHTIYTIRVEAYTAIGPGPPSPPVQVNNTISLSSSFNIGPNYMVLLAVKPGEE